MISVINCYCIVYLVYYQINFASHQELCMNFFNLYTFLMFSLFFLFMEGFFRIVLVYLTAKTFFKKLLTIINELALFVACIKLWFIFIKIDILIDNIIVNYLLGLFKAINISSSFDWRIQINTFLSNILIILFLWLLIKLLFLQTNT